MTLIATLLVIISTSVYGAFGSNSTGFGNSLFANNDFLPVDEAFKFSSRVENDTLILSWDITEGYYLYKERFTFNSTTKSTSIGTPSYSIAGDPKDDPYFGDVTVFHDDMTVELPITILNGNEASIEVSYQGCADAGLCYPPQTKTALFIKQASQSTSSTASADNVSTGNISTDNVSTDSIPADYETANGIFSFLESSSIFAIVGIFFLLGIGLTFTPCVFPMIPIISTIIAGQKNPTTWRSFSLSFAYVLGMSLTYATAGVITGLLGASANIQAYLQAPAVLITFAIIFVLLALSMFGFYELQLPEKLRNRLNTKSQSIKGGHLLSVFFIGSLSALIVSPCVSAPLAGALLYISTTADATLGGLSLLALGLGMGVPLMAVGVGGSKFLPKAGHWMDVVKSVFGVMLIAVAIWLLERLLSPSITLLLWSLLLGLTGAQMGAFESAKPGWQRIAKGLGLFFVLYASTLFIGSMTGASDPLNPLEKIISDRTPTSETTQTNNSHFKTVFNLEEFNQLSDKSINEGKPVLLDFYADWCISCKVMEREVFSKQEVANLMSEFTLIQVDVTKNDTGNQQFLEKFGLFGPPSILFFDASGAELETYRVMGEMNKEQFTLQLNKVLSALQKAS